MSLLHVLLDIDKGLFHLINQTWSNPVFDAVLPLFRERILWAPLYVFIAAFSVLNFGNRGWWVVLAVVLAVALADVTSSRFVKKAVGRLRPCNDPEMADNVRLRLPACGSGFSFTSSHAANHFAAALVFIGFFGKIRRWVAPAALMWALAVSYAQVYVGVHYPGDVLGGGMLGVLCGWGAVRAVKWITGLKK